MNENETKSPVRAPVNNEQALERLPVLFRAPMNNAQALERVTALSIKDRIAECDWVLARDTENGTVLGSRTRALLVLFRRQLNDLANAAPEASRPHRTLQQRVNDVGGRTNAAGYLEFGSPQALDALILGVLKDHAPHSREDAAIDRGELAIQLQSRNRHLSIETARAQVDAVLDLAGSSTLSKDTTTQ